MKLCKRNRKAEKIKLCLKCLPNLFFKFFSKLANNIYVSLFNKLVARWLDEGI